MNFAFIDAEKARFPISRMCYSLDVSQSGFFAWKGRPASRRQREDTVLLAHIGAAFELSNGTYGSPRMYRDLVDDGHVIARRPAIARYIDGFYNPVRRHSSLNFKSPIQFERTAQKVSQLLSSKTEQVQNKPASKRCSIRL